MEIGNIVSELGGGAAAAILLTWVLNQAFAINPRFLPVTALVSGWGLSLAITAATNVPVDRQAWIAAVVLGLFAGLAAVGLYRTTEKAVGRQSGSYRGGSSG